MATDYRRHSNLPRGIRNNNPGNMVTGPGWKGEVGHDGRFSIFDDIANGVRAWIIDLHTDITIHGQDTVRKRVEAYAPPSENHTEAYVQGVAQALGVDADDRIPTDYESVKTMFYTHMQIENGAEYSGYISDADFQEGFDRVPALKRAFFLRLTQPKRLPV